MLMIIPHPHRADGDDPWDGLVDRLEYPQEREGRVGTDCRLVVPDTPPCQSG